MHSIKGTVGLGGRGGDQAYVDRDEPIGETAD
jgi:hypothetical protein